MVWMAGAAGVALDALAALQKALTPPAASGGGAGFAVSSDSDPAGAPPARSAACQALAPATLQALMAQQGAPTIDRMSSAIFSALDADGDGQLSRSEFTTAFSGGSAGRGLAQLMQKQTQLLAPPGQSVALTA